MKQKRYWSMPEKQTARFNTHIWDFPGKSTGVGCHFLLQCMKVKSESEVTQSCPTLSDPMDCSLPGSSAHGIFQARVLEWSAIAFSSTNDPIFQSINYLLNAKVENLHFAFSLKITLAIQGLLCFHTNCKIIFPSSVKNIIGSLIELHWIYRLLQVA